MRFSRNLKDFEEKIIKKRKEIKASNVYKDV